MGQELSWATSRQEKPWVSLCGVCPDPARATLLGTERRAAHGIQGPSEGTGWWLTRTSSAQTHFYYVKAYVTLAQSSPQGCGFTQQLDRSWIKCMRGSQPSLPLPGAGALVLRFGGLWLAAARPKGLLQLKVKLGETLIRGESCWLLPLPLVPLLKLLMRDRALSEFEVESLLKGDEEQETQTGSEGRVFLYQPPEAVRGCCRQHLHQTLQQLVSCWGWEHHKGLFLSSCSPRSPMLYNTVKAAAQLQSSQSLLHPSLIWGGGEAEEMLSLYVDSIITSQVTGAGES